MEELEWWARLPWRDPMKTCTGQRKKHLDVADILDVGFVDELVESRTESSLETTRIAELLSAEGELKSYVSKRLHLSSYEISQRDELVICSSMALQ